MFTLLIIIYLSFISLGLPDSLLGAAWPSMYGEIGAPLSSAGAISMIIAGGTIVSSLLSERVIHKFGTSYTTLFSVLLTAAALFGFSFAPSMLWLCAAALPLGLGAGAVDAALNNFVAIHYQAKHMSWLHCFWGIGATVGPAIMSCFLLNQGGWHTGYRTIAIIQSILVVVLLCSLPLWKKTAAPASEKTDAAPAGNRRVLTLPGVRYALIAFFCYCSLEATTMLWSASFLVSCKGMDAGKAAGFTSVFFIGITAGRALSGFLTMKCSSENLIRLGQLLALAGAVVLLLPLPSLFYGVGLLLIGLGCAPIFPSMLHETPYRFGQEASQAVMGLQMAFAYTGTTFMPPLLGLISGKISLGVLPVFLLVYALVMIFACERLNRFVARQRNRTEDHR